MSPSFLTRGAPLFLFLGVLLVVGVWQGSEVHTDPRLALCAQAGGLEQCLDLCGNGVLDPPFEQCDHGPGNGTQGDSCTSSCALQCERDDQCASGRCDNGLCALACGNGVVDPPRPCDDPSLGVACGNARVIVLGPMPTAHVQADLNVDGFLDIIVTDVQEGKVRVFLNAGDGSFGTAILSTAILKASEVAAGDFDLDGKIDLAVSQAIGGGIAVLRGKGDGTFDTPVVQSFGAQSIYRILPGDVNGDGDADLLIAQGTKAYMLFGAAGLSFEDPAEVGFTDGARGQLLQDVSGDGLLDVVLSSPNGIDPNRAHADDDPNRYRITEFINRGDGRFSDYNSYFSGSDPRVQMLRSADVNRDGVRDVIVDEQGQFMTVYLRRTVPVQPEPMYAASHAGGHALVVGKFNNDILPDLAFATYDEVFSTTGDADGGFSAPVRVGMIGKAPGAQAGSSQQFASRSMVAGDLNRDGIDDLSIVRPDGGPALTIILSQNGRLACESVAIMPCVIPGEACDDANTDDTDACTNRCEQRCVPGQLCPDGQACPSSGICPVLCGNGVVDAGEDCDDGNLIDTDQCTLTCRERNCTPGQLCPDGQACPASGICPDLCGNGTVDAGEQCDDGNPTANDTCLQNCRFRPCTPGQICPDGQVCPLNGICLPLLCGNGVVNVGEACDDGNEIDVDQCSNECEARCTPGLLCPDGQLCPANGICPPTLCGNNLVDLGEQCDDGPNNRSWLPDKMKEMFCKPQCVRPACADGLDNDGDGLSDEDDPGCYLYLLSLENPGLTAQVITTLPPMEMLVGKDDEGCPAGTIDRVTFCARTCEQGEICADGQTCLVNGTCPIQLCGNGVIDAGEACDSGLPSGNDLCDATCHVSQAAGTCGDGVMSGALGEQCDDGNQIDSDACNNACRVRCDSDDDCTSGICNEATGVCSAPYCGDSQVNTYLEQCDDGDLVDTDECRNNCKLACSAHSDCPSGECDFTSMTCVAPCGNGRLDPGEQCDDDNLSNNDACSNRCEIRCANDAQCSSGVCDESNGVCIDLCGNGVVDAGESCDDRNNSDTDTCTNACRIRCLIGTLCPDGRSCPVHGVCPAGLCGDGRIDAEEQCDDGNTIAGDACSPTCMLRCDAAHACPDGLLCEGGACNRCTSSLQCPNGFCVDGHCRGALPLCGNGTIESGEVCDDGNGEDNDGCTVGCAFGLGHACAAGAECDSKLCDGGSCQPCGGASQCGSGLRCSEGRCLLEGNACGNGVVEPGEACDDMNRDDQDGCTMSCRFGFNVACTHPSQCQSNVCTNGVCAPCADNSACPSGLRCALGQCLTDAQMSLLPNVCGNGLPEAGEACDDNNALGNDGCTPLCTVGNEGFTDVAATIIVELPFTPAHPTEDTVHGSGDDLPDTGPALVVGLAAGGAAGVAWIRRRFRKTSSPS